MNCPKCGQEMRQGFLFSTKDWAFSFADEVPSVLGNGRTTFHDEVFLASSKRQALL